MEIKSALQFLVEEGVIYEPTEDKNFNLIITRDCYVSRVKAINRAMKKYAAQFIDCAAQNVNDFETLVDTYDCINRRNEDVSMSILKIKELIK